MSRFLDLEDAARFEHDDDKLKIFSSRPAGGAYFQRQLWRLINLDQWLCNIIDYRLFTAPIAEAIFAMVSNRALTSSFKLAIE